MNFERENKENYALVSTKVEKLDTTNAPELKSELVMINKDGVNNIVLDMSDSRYCDSSGLSAILVANRLCKNSNGSFILTGIQESVMKLITISQLHTVLNIAPSISEAEDLLKMQQVERDLDKGE